MALQQAALLPARPAARLLSAALWHGARNETIDWAASAGCAGLATPEPPESPSRPSEPASARDPAHTHTSTSPFLERLGCLRSVAPPILPAAAAAAAAPWPCQATPPCPWPGALLPFHLRYATSVSSWQAGISASAHAKRAPQPTSAEGAYRAAAGAGSPTGGSAAGGSAGSNAVGKAARNPSGSAGDGAAGSGGKGASRAKAEPVKEMRLKPRIAEHDLGYKLRQMEGWLADGLRAKLVVEFRAADQSEAAAALVDSVVARLAGKGQPLGLRQQHKDAWFVTLRPLAPKKPQQPKQQQEQQEKPRLPQQQQQQQQQQLEQEQQEQGPQHKGVAGPVVAASAAAA